MKFGPISATIVASTVLLILCPRTTPAADRKAHDHHLMYELRKTAHLLSKADRDYKGHRANAVKQIHHAIGELKKEAHLQGFKGEGNAYKGPEPQAVSDAQLRKAIGELRHIHKQLKDLPSTKLRKKAEEHVHHAIEDLKKALAVA